VYLFTFGCEYAIAMRWVQFRRENGDDDKIDGVECAKIQKRKKKASLQSSAPYLETMLDCVGALVTAHLELVVCGLRGRL
jgi:hypothetical protein